MLHSLKRNFAKVFFGDSAGACDHFSSNLNIKYDHFFTNM